MKPTKKRVVRAWLVLPEENPATPFAKYPEIYFGRKPVVEADCGCRAEVRPCTISYQLPATKGREVKRV